MHVNEWCCELIPQTTSYLKIGNTHWIKNPINQIKDLQRVQPKSGVAIVSPFIIRFSKALPTTWNANKNEKIMNNMFIEI